MTGKVKILHLTYHMGIGGTEQVIYHAIVCIEGEIGPIGQKLQETGTEFHVVKRVPGFDIALLKAVRNLIQTKQADIIHCHQYTPFVYGVLAALFSKTKVIFTEHGRFHPDRYSWKRRMINPLLGLATFSITAISEATKNALAHYEWFSKKSIKVIYNGIEANTSVTNSSNGANELGLTDKHLVFGTITRFDTIKNLPMMIVYDFVRGNVYVEMLCCYRSWG